MLLKDPRRTIHAINNSVTVNVPMTTLDVSYVTDNLDYELIARNLNLDVEKINHDFASIVEVIGKLDSEIESVIEQVNTNTYDINELKKFRESFEEDTAEKIVEITKQFDGLVDDIRALDNITDIITSFIDVGASSTTLSAYVSTQISERIAATALSDLKDVSYGDMSQSDIPTGSILSWAGDEWVVANVDGGEF